MGCCKEIKPMEYQFQREHWWYYLTVNENLRHVLPLLYCIVLFVGNWLGTVYVELLWSACRAFVEPQCIPGQELQITQERRKKSTYSRIFKNVAIDKPNVGDFCRVLENAAQSGFVAAFSKNTNIGLSLQPRFKNAAIGPKPQPQL